MQIRHGHNPYNPPKKRQFRLAVSPARQPSITIFRLDSFAASIEPIPRFALLRKRRSPRSGVERLRAMLSLRGEPDTDFERKRRRTSCSCVLRMSFTVMFARLRPMDSLGSSETPEFCARIEMPGEARRFTGLARYFPRPDRELTEISFARSLATATFEQLRHYRGTVEYDRLQAYNRSESKQGKTAKRAFRKRSKRVWVACCLLAIALGFDAYQYKRMQQLDEALDAYIGAARPQKRDRRPLDGIALPGKRPFHRGFSQSRRQRSITQISTGPRPAKAL